MDIEVVDLPEELPENDPDSTAVVLCTHSPQVDAKISKLLNALSLHHVKVSNGVEVFQRYIQKSPQLLIINNNLSKMSCEQLLGQIGKINSSTEDVTKVLVISDDNDRNTIIRIMRPVKTSKGSIKLGLMISPWNVPDFYRQLANLNPDNVEFKLKIDKVLEDFRLTEIKSLDETRLFLGVTEIGQGLRIDLGNDRILSESSDTADDYAAKIEKALLATSVEYIQFSLEATTDLLPANVVAMMMLINGFSSKHKKEILFVAIPPEVKSQILKFGLGEILPLEQDVDLF